MKLLSMLEIPLSVALCPFAVLASPGQGADPLFDTISALDAEVFAAFNACSDPAQQSSYAVLRRLFGPAYVDMTAPVVELRDLEDGEYFQAPASFDVGLAIDTLRVRHAGTDEMYVRFDAAIRPIDVALLSRAFGWPEFQGTLFGDASQSGSGVLPNTGISRGTATRSPGRSASSAVQPSSWRNG